MHSPIPPASPAWWLAPPAQEATGLSTDDARDALTRCGPNTLEARRERSLAMQFLARFRNPLVLILLAASAISAATGDVANFAIIATMVLLSVVLDFVQEHRAGRAADKLRASVAAC